MIGNCVSKKGHDVDKQGNPCPMFRPPAHAPLHELPTRPAPSTQAFTNHSIHSSIHSLDVDLAGSTEGPDVYRDGLRRAQSTDSLGSVGGALSSRSLGYNHKAKSASHLDESDFGPLVGAECTGPEGLDAGSLGSIHLPASHFLLTKDQEKAIKAMTPEQEETASLLSSISQAPDTSYLTPTGYRLVSESEWNLLQQEVSACRACDHDRVLEVEFHRPKHHLEVLLCTLVFS